MNFRPSFCALLTTLVALAAFSPAASQAHTSPSPGEQDVQTPHHSERMISGSLRGAMVSGTDDGLPTGYLCGDMTIGPRLAMVGCGSGSGFMTPQLPGAGPEIAHFRLDLSLPQLIRSPYLELSVGAGLAEAELGPDELGFVFNPGAQQNVVEVAGPEVAAGLKFTPPTAGPVFDLRAHLDVGVAWLPGWTAIGGPGGDLAPFAVLTANGRF